MNGTLIAISNILSSLGGSGGLAEHLGFGGGLPGLTFLGGLGIASESPSTMFTKQNSIRAMNTNIVQTDINASTAFRYETGGNVD